MQRLLLVAAILAFAHGSGSPILAEPHIVGGRGIKIEAAPYTASVVIKYDHACGGVILSPTKVLTLASCLYPDSTYPGWHHVRVGSTSHLKGGQYIEAARVDQHPYYDRFELEYNIGIITLKRAILIGERLKTRVVALGTEPPVPGQNLTVTGFGYTQPGSSDGNQTLSSIDVPVVNRETCLKMEQYMKHNLTETMFCAGGNGKNFHSYDSGSPAVNQNQELVGIALFREYKNVKNTPGVYLNVSSPMIRAFINEYIDL